MYWLKLTYLFTSEFYKEFTEGLLTVFFITENGKGHFSDLKQTIIISKNGYNM